MADRPLWLAAWLACHMALASTATLDLDPQQPIASGERYLCYQEDLEVAITEALATNYSGLGWSADLVVSLMGNLTGCNELRLDSITSEKLLSLTPLALALQSNCDANAKLPLWEATRSIQVLELEGSLIEDAGAIALTPALRACPWTALHLPTNNIADEGARAIADALLGPGDGPPHSTVRILDFHANHIGDYGADGLAAVLRLPAAQYSPVPLLELRLHENMIGDHGVQCARPSVPEICPEVCRLRPVSLSSPMPYFIHAPPLPTSHTVEIPLSPCTMAALCSSQPPPSCLCASVVPPRLRATAQTHR